METPPPIDNNMSSNGAPKKTLFAWDNVEFRKRVISAVFLAPIVLGCIAAGGVWFYTLMILLAIFMMREWDALHRHHYNRIWEMVGVAYVTIMCLSIIRLREETLGGDLSLLLYLLLVVWATDIGAYFTGRQIGGPKLAPAISPSKTWSGLAGGILSACVIGVVLSIFFQFPLNVSQALWMSAILAIVAQAGDLFESWMKRKAGVKDSGTLIPGHGGILDRVDGFTFSAPLLVILHIIAMNQVVVVVPA